MGAQEKRRERGVVCCIKDAGKEVLGDLISPRYARPLVAVSSSVINDGQFLLVFSKS